MAGDELRLRHPGDSSHAAWMSVGHVIRLTPQEEVALELRNGQVSALRQVKLLYRPVRYQKWLVSSHGKLLETLASEAYDKCFKHTP